MEIERKWKMRRAPALPVLTHTRVFQSYLSVTPEVRIRKYEDLKSAAPPKYDLTVKSEGTLAREEIIKPLTAEEYRILLEMTGGANTVAAAMGLTTAAALAYLFFNLFTPPCFAAIGAMNSEMQHKGWLWSAIALQLCTGYTVAFIVYQFGTLFTEGHLGEGFVPGLIAIAIMVVVIVLIARKIRASFDEQYELHQKTKTAAQTV